MFGKLTLAAIPFHSPIIMGAMLFMAFVVVMVVVLLTWFHRWRWLWTEYLTSLDHKKIGIMYLVLTGVMLLRGITDAMMMRVQQAMSYGPDFGYLTPQHFDQIFSAHGTIMILFVAMPFLIGLMNIAVPLQIGARDVAFPFLNAISFFLTVAGAALVLVSLGIGEFAQNGWSAYAPLSGPNFQPGVGIDYWIWSLQIAGAGTLLSGINFFATLATMRAPGMRLWDMPIFCWTTLCTVALILGAFPILTVTISELALDRYLGMHFFTNELGGNQMMYVNLFWAWGHPEVYILILPAFGIFSEVTATFSKKQLFSYVSMVWAAIAITVLSFIVWLHHFFTMGAGPEVNTFFGIMTMIIAIPTGVKVFNWIFTMYQGRVRMFTPMLWTVGFIVTFVIGGMTGVLLATPAADYVVHNSLFLVAHFHNVIIGGALFGFFAAFAYWFPKMFGFTLNERIGKAAFWCWIIGFYLAFMPLYILGFMGMTRRLQHYDNPLWQPYLVVALVGAVFVLVGVLFQIAQIVASIKDRKEHRDVTGDPWDGRTLEWSTASPAPPYNFAQVPEVQGRDVFDAIKKKRFVPKPVAYQDICLPRNTPSAMFVGALAFLFAFAFVWHIWWLVCLSALVVFAILVHRWFNEDTEYRLSADDVKRIEEQRLSFMEGGGS